MSSEFGADATRFIARFGELVQYTPRGGSTRNVWAVVDRRPVQGIPEASRARSPLFNLWVLADASTATYGGIDPDEINTGGDTITLSERYGSTTKTRPVSNVLHTDPGMLQLELR